ncbi:MAG TPA: amino acid permease [Chromatiaceae bacterium]|nr:amino acid permease [Chromatiaceae bacterium]
MVLYGLGTTIGAGIYALVGELAGIAGYFAPLSFLLASLMAALTAMSFAELSGRFPRAAGAALYVQEGFSAPRLAALTGMLVIMAGLVSSAALINGFVGYLNQFVDIGRLPAIILLAVLLGGVAAWGISTSVALAATITVIEISGLLIVIGVSVFNLPADVRLSMLLPTFTWSHWHPVFAGSLLAFYAFIGFEDMVDVAEEVKDVKRSLPKAILITLGITTLLYMAIMVTAVLAVPPERLALAEAPLAFLYQHFTGRDAVLISIIGLLAIINGALIQMIMASRVMYGLSSRGQLPAVLGFVHPKTHTPVVATLVVTGVVLFLALIGHLSILAESTSFIMLGVFSMVNLALLHIKRRSPETVVSIRFPVAIPFLGFVVSFGFLLLTLFRSF